MAFARGAGDVVIERASPVDMMELAADVGPVPAQVGAILVFGPGTRLTAGMVREALADRIRGVPRLRQRLVATPPGCGRPVWVDDPGDDVTRHVHDLRCPPPGDEEALLRVAAGVVTRRLPPDRPLWSATLVTGLAGDACALIVVFHHVMADGMGGLAVLANLVDGAAGPPPPDFPRPPPSWRELAREAATARLRALTRLPRGAARVRDALAELRPGPTPRAPRCSLNRPVGTRRGVGVVRADLARVRAAGHDRGGTVNDVLLAAVGGALDSLLAQRGEHVDHVVVSAPISGRTQAAAAGLGNEVGVVPVAVPLSGRPLDRLGSIAATTRAHKAGTRGASAALLAPVFRGLAVLGVLRWLIERQRLVTTFVTNLRGPDAPLSFLGSTIAEVIPLSIVAGNVPVAFAVLSYAGTLTVTVTVDLDAVPDSGVLVAALRDHFDAITGRGQASPG
ncbi:MAG TPA: wax ester/triacylglycerol synthase domain-containing protein [Acidimicrobiales bacterium]|nr:wax ester/triacylglycerol synthase domain-containing protein [Acidimicrobiales bacterium]